MVKLGGQFGLWATGRKKMLEVAGEGAGWVDQQSNGVKSNGKKTQRAGLYGLFFFGSSKKLPVVTFKACMVSKPMTQNLFLRSYKQKETFSIYILLC